MNIKNLTNIAVRVIVYIWVVFIMFLIPYFFFNYNSSKMKKVANNSNLKLWNENNKIKEINNEKSKCHNCPYVNRCDLSSRPTTKDYAKADTTSGESSSAESQ